MTRVNVTYPNGDEYAYMFKTKDEAKQFAALLSKELTFKILENER